MVVAGVLALALALPTGALFGIGYGTGVRIGYEQIYPLLFPPDDKGNRQPATAVKNVKAINDIYNAIGGKEASQMGIAVGLSSAMSELDKNPDFLALLKLESSLSGSTSSNLDRNRYGLDDLSPQPDLSSEIEEFNKDNPSDVEKLDRYRGYTITQLRNIIISTTDEQSKRLATLVLNEKLQQDQGTGKSTPITPPPVLEILAKTNVRIDPTKDHSVYLTWLGKLNTLKASYQTNANTIKLLLVQQGRIQRQNNPRVNAERIRLQQKLGSLTNKNRGISSQIRQMSNDYRNSNNNIRLNALGLRKEIAAGKWTTRRG